MQFRLATIADLDSLRVADPCATKSQARQRFLADRTAAKEVTIVKQDGDVQGYVVLEHAFFGHAFISLISVRPALRRQGIGLALIRSVESACPTGKLFTSTNESNRVAQALFLKAGFRQSGRIENLDEGDDELVFFKPVARAASA